MSQNVSLDGTDLRLLQELNADARASGAVLAAAVGISESTGSLRLKRLRSLGVIRGFNIDVDRAGSRTAGTHLDSAGKT